MNKPITVIVAISLLALPISEAVAKRYKHHGRVYSYRHSYRGNSDFYIHDSNRLRYGSNAWWRQMLREGRVRN
jgi:hypothetical protein